MSGRDEEMAVPGPGFLAFAEAFRPLLWHVDGCDTCDAAFELSDPALLCATGRELANTIDRAAGIEPRF